MFSENRNKLEPFHTSLKLYQKQKIKRQLWNAQLSIVIQTCNYELKFTKLKFNAKLLQPPVETINRWPKRTQSENGTN